MTISFHILTNKKLLLNAINPINTLIYEKNPLYYLRPSDTDFKIHGKTLFRLKLFIFLNYPDSLSLNLLFTLYIMNLLFLNLIAKQIY